MLDSSQEGEHDCSGTCERWRGNQRNGGDGFPHAFPGVFLSGLLAIRFVVRVLGVELVP